MHRHHIIPKHAGGSNDPSNIVLLSVEDHALAHKKLYETFGRHQDLIAYRGLAGLANKKELLQELGNKYWVGQKHSEKTKKKMSASAIGRRRSEESKLKQSNSVSGISNHFFGKTHSDEIKLEMSNKKKVQYVRAGNPKAIKVKVSDINGNIYEFGCLKDCADSFNLNWWDIRKYLINYEKDNSYKPKAGHKTSFIVSIERIL